ncbi:hypothetical protein NQ318_001596 [Aromia moschata]|uniref:Transmembrane protein 115 n=1 Tax=Aromia moschata TaxID=1265417 RepID=A0AAV8Y3G7_9CUCU|nr:hypothetical protein NQ318_001596 [Aromia moschata]
MEMLTFFAIVNFGVAVITTACYFILYCCTFNTEYLFTVHIHGLAGYIAGVSVAVKQIMPDLVIIKTPFGKLSNRNIPLTVSFLSVIFKLVGLLDGTYPSMFFSGLLVSWVYLRFYQKHTNGSRGDMADYFTFASFFPNVIQPPIAVLSNSIHSGLVRIGICRKVVRKFDIANPTGITVSVPGGTDQHDMERRRQIALKALSERLSKSYSDKQPLIPSKPNTKPLIPSNKSSVSEPIPSTSEQLQILPSQHLQINIPPSEPTKSDT